MGHTATEISMPVDSGGRGSTHLLVQLLVRREEGRVRKGELAGLVVVRGLDCERHGGEEEEERQADAALLCSHCAVVST